MFNFKEFPAKIRYKQVDRHGDHILTRDVEVFGFLKIGLMAFRELDNFDPQVRLIPIPEFNELFKDYVLVE